jgi:hypothetical protein
MRVLCHGSRQRRSRRPDRGCGGPPTGPLADLRAEFQRTMSEPPTISRRATAWWPTVVALEQVMDAGTATALAVSRGAQVSPSGVRQLCDAVRALLGVLGTGERLTVLC